MKIYSISDLDGRTDAEIEDVRSSIDIRGHYYSGSAILGAQEGLTLDDYLKWEEAPPTETCRSCEGTGLFKKPVRSVGTVHASSAHTCVRRLYYDIVADKPPIQKISRELQVVFAIGHAIHDQVQKALHASFSQSDEQSFEDEVRVDLPEAFVSNSRTDGLIQTSNAKVVLEIKTIGKEFEKLKGPKKEHIMQAMGIYATALDAPFVSFLYVSKEYPHPVKEFVLVYDPKPYDRWWKKKGDKIEAALGAKTPPIADSNKSDCQQCGYKYFCEQRIR